MDGERKAPGSIRIGYFSQDQMDELSLGETVYDHVQRAMPKGTLPAKVRAKAAQLGFSVEKVETKVEKLSGGEKVRLLMGLMAMTEPHILILDEPTSHLDIDSREALIYALNDYRGAVLLITHDVYLAEGTADQLWLVKDGKAREYDGDLNDYKKLVMAADRDQSKTSKAPAPKEEVVVEQPVEKVDKAAQRQKAADARKAAAPLKKKADAAEKRLEKANARVAAIDEELVQPNLSSERMQALMKERAEQTDLAEVAETEWLEASEAYEEATSGLS